MSISLEQGKEQLEALKKNPLIVKEGVEYQVAINFS